jgi:hypothetical protein
MHEVCQNPEDRRMSLRGPKLECWAESPFLRKVSMICTEHYGYDFLCLGPNYRTLLAARYSVQQGVRMATGRTIVGNSQVDSGHSIVGGDEIVYCHTPR